MTAILIACLAVLSSAATARDASPFRFIPHEVGPAEVEQIRIVAEAQLARASDYIGAPVDFEIRCHVFPTLEAKGLATGYTLPCHTVVARNELFASVEAGFEHELPREVAALALRRLLGRTKVDALATGLAIYLTPDHTRDWYRTVAGRLAGIEGEGDLGLLFDNRAFARESYLTMRAHAFALVDHLVELWGKDVFLRRYTTWSPTRDQVLAMETDWRAYQAWLAASVEPPKATRSLPNYQRGFCHAHEGYRVYNGYISRANDEALARLARLGTNAVSITPFTYMRSPRAPAPLPFSSSPGSENDESVVHASLAARDLGMAVMLKPHVWLNNSWPGDVEMSSDDEWELFFDYYYRWIRHYAILADLHDIEILCVGVELSKTTAAREDRWIELVSRLRRLYGGKIVYASNWGSEFETLEFWRAFDYIGVNCYYPLSDREDATDEQLLAGANAALDKLEAVSLKNGVPLLITEVGFVSASSPWIKPYERPRGQPVDMTAQARCYDAFFTAMRGRDTIAGVYWWKWPTYLEYGGHSHSGFTPNGKSAELVVEKWFESLSGE